MKFTVLDRYIWDYNSLPEWSRNKYQVEGINANKTYITDGGLDHLGKFYHFACISHMLPFPLVFCGLLLPPV